MSRNIAKHYRDLGFTQEHSGEVGGMARKTVIYHDNGQYRVYASDVCRMPVSNGFSSEVSMVFADNYKSLVIASGRYSAKKAQEYADNIEHYANLLSEGITYDQPVAV